MDGPANILLTGFVAYVCMTVDYC